MLPDALMAPVADDWLNAAIHSWILEDLPSLNRYAGSIGESIARVLTHMHNDAAAHQAEEQATCTDAQCPKTVSKKFPFVSQGL